MSERFRKKPVEIETVQWTGENIGEIREFMEPYYPLIPNYNTPKWDKGRHYRYLVIHTLEGDHQAKVGDWIIKGVQGEFYPCKPRIFKMTYEPASHDPPQDEKIREKIKDVQDAMPLKKNCTNLEHKKTHNVFPRNPFCGDCFADQILALTTSHYTEKIKELEVLNEKRQELLTFQHLKTVEYKTKMENKLQQAEQETARKMIEKLQELLELSAKVKEPAIKVKMTAILRAMESKYGVSK